MEGEAVTKHEWIAKADGEIVALRGGSYIARVGPLLARQIVREHNAHDPLVEALRDLVDEQALFAAQLPPIYATRLEKARTALKLAEGGA